MEDLLNEVRMLWHLLLAVGQELHAEESITLGMRAVLEQLAWEGPATVPAIARARYVTRQHIQVLVNGLLDQELVELQDNPAHKRSPLVCLTREGERTIKRMKGRERPVLAKNYGVSGADLERAAEVLRAVRGGLGRGSR
jgi:DNA-binding MarR family transcriptional regulator